MYIYIYIHNICICIALDRSHEPMRECIFFKLHTRIHKYPDIQTPTNLRAPFAHSHTQASRDVAQDHYHESAPSEPEEDRSWNYGRNPGGKGFTASPPTQDLETNLAPFVGGGDRGRQVRRVYVYMYTYIYICVYICIYICIYIYMYIYMM